MAKRKREPAEKKPSRFSGRGCLWIVLLCAGITFFSQRGTPNGGVNVTAYPAPTKVGQVRPTATRTAEVAEVNSLALVEVKTETMTATRTLTTFATRAASRTPAPTGIPVTSNFYAVGNANARSCPQTTCEIVGRLAAGDTVKVAGSENGEAVQGSSTWRKILLNGQTAYVHGSLLSSSKPVLNSSGGNTASQNNTGSNGNASSVVVSTAPPNMSTPTTPPVAWICQGDIYNCGDFATWNEANAYFQACPGDPSNLDGDGNLIPCESLR